MDEMNRRDFLLTSAMFTAACGAGSKDLVTSPGSPSSYTLPQGARIVFQGDSITDANRSNATTEPNDPDSMGYGYVQNIAQHLLFTYPDKQLSIFNRSEGGDTVASGQYQLQSRWQQDTIDFQPDLLSILVGINDFVADYTDPNVSVTYEQNYKALIDTTRQALPHVQFVILEPYVMTSTPNTPVPGWQAMRDAAASVAVYANAIYVPLQDMFTQYANAQTPTYWIDADTAHPTIAGSAAIAKQWLQYVGL